MSFHSMLRGLQDAGVRYVVIGGVAGTVHGSAHVTQDLDVCYDTADENRSALAGLLRRWEAHLRGAPEDLPFVLDARTLRDTPFLTLRTREGDIALLDRVPGVGGYPECLDASEPVRWEEIEFRVLSLPALVAAKRHRAPQGPGTPRRAGSTARDGRAPLRRRHGGRPALIPTPDPNPCTTNHFPPNTSRNSEVRP